MIEPADQRDEAPTVKLGLELARVELPRIFGAGPGSPATPLRLIFFPLEGEMLEDQPVDPLPGGLDRAVAGSVGGGATIGKLEPLFPKIEPVETA